jgi:hypothetical protein
MNLVWVYVHLGSGVGENLFEGCAGSVGEARVQGVGG